MGTIAKMSETVIGITGAFVFGLVIDTVMLISRYEAMPRPAREPAAR